MMTDLVVTKLIPAPIDAVFAALTDPAAMEVWFVHGPGGSARIRMDPVPGGSYSFTLRRPGSADLTATGVFLEVAQPHRLTFTWSTPLTEQSTVTIDLVERDPSSTLLTLTHALPEHLHRPHREAWTVTLDNLAGMLGRN